MKALIQNYRLRVKISLLLLCYATICAAGIEPDTSSVDPHISISTSVNPFIAPAHVDIDFAVEGFRNFEYLRVISDRDGFNKLNIGYDKYILYDGVVDVNYEYVEIILKDFDGTANWSLIQFRPNGKSSARVSLEGYIADAQMLGDGWLKIQIPLSDFGAGQSYFSELKHITFPHSQNAGMFDIGIREIRFVGDGKEFEWLGPDKNDNSHDGDNTGPRLMAYKVYGDGLSVEKIQVINSEGEVVGEKTQMPFSVPVNLTAGDHHLIGKATDNLGNSYYSDSLDIYVGDLSATVTDVSCNGLADGAIDVMVSGGTPPYDFNWSNGSSEEDLMNVAAGVYMLTVTDAMGKEATLTKEVKEPPMLSANLDDQDCTADSVTLMAFGGTTPYQYAVDGGGFQWFGDNQQRIRTLLEAEGNDLDDPGPYYDCTNCFYDVATDTADNIYFTGWPKSTITFNTGDTVNGFYLTKLNKQNNVEWIITADTQYQTNYYKGQKPLVAVDSENKIIAYISFRHDAELFFESGSMMVSAGYYIFKFNDSGELINYRSIPVSIVAMDIDSKDNLYAAGRVSNSSNINFDGFKLQATSSTHSYLFKLDNTATVEWLTQSSGNDALIEDLEVNDSGDVIATGHFGVTTTFGDFTLNSAGSADIFVLRMNTDGEFVWVTSAGGNVSDKAYAITFDKSDGNILITANTGKNAHYGSIIIEEYNSYDIAKMKTSTGEFIFAKIYDQLTSFSLGSIEDIKTDKSGNIYVTGQKYLKKLDGYGNELISFDINDNYGYNYPDFHLAFKSNNGLITPGFGRLGFSIFEVNTPTSVRIPVGFSDIAIKDANGCMTEVEMNGTSEATEICYATVAPSDGILINWSASAGDVQEIYRETNRLGEYDLIGTSGAGEESFTDTDADPLVRSYRYKLKTIQSCSGESDFSAPHKTMHLTVNEGNKGQINLIWDGYEGFEYKSFQIYRGATPEDMEFLAEVPSNLFTYTDYDPSPSTLYYQISVEADGNCDPNKSTTNGKTAEGIRVVQSNIANKFGQLGGLSLYPNPASDRINIRFNPDGNSYNLSMIDMKGRVVRSQEGLFDRGTIYTQNLPQGIYTIIVTDEKGSRLRGNVVVR